MLDKQGGKKAGLPARVLAAAAPAPRCVAEVMPSTHKSGHQGNARHRKI